MYVDIKNGASGWVLDWYLKVLHIFFNHNILHSAPYGHCDVLPEVSTRTSHQSSCKIKLGTST
jgi:hypothetical protein